MLQSVNPMGHDRHMPTDHQYMQLYNPITLQFISPTGKIVGYPSGEAYYRSVVFSVFGNFVIVLYC